MSGGKKVAPQKIENLLKTNPLVSQAMIVGGGERPLMALIALDQSRTSELAKEEGVEFTSPSEMTSHPWVMAQIKAFLREKNRELAPFEAVTRFSILSREFAVGEEELTPTLKLRRQIIMERYKELIDEMSRKQRVEL
jgi:long-chain acyl-CoA synthetase